MAVLERLIPLLGQTPRWLLLFALVVIIQLVTVVTLLAVYLGRAVLNANTPPAITAIPIISSSAGPPRAEQPSAAQNDSRRAKRPASPGRAPSAQTTDQHASTMKELGETTTVESSASEMPSATVLPAPRTETAAQSQRHEANHSEESVEPERDNILLAEAVMTFANGFPTARLTLQNLSAESQVLTELRLNVSYYNRDIAYYVPYVAGETATIQLHMPGKKGEAVYRLDRAVVIPPGTSALLVIRFTAISSAGNAMGAHNAGAYRFRMSLRTMTGLVATTGELGW